MHVWSSRAVVCEPRRPGLVGPPGFHTTAREPKRAHLRAPALQKPHQNSTKGPPRERRKNENCGGEGKKSAKFWAVRRRGPRRGGPGKRAGEHTNLGPDTHSRHTQGDPAEPVLSGGGHEEGCPAEGRGVRRKVGRTLKTAHNTRFFFWGGNPG